nr:lytic transglycosylase domain-containing protein [Myxococcota bacterium]
WFDDRVRVAGWFAFSLAVGLAAILLVAPQSDPRHARALPTDPEGEALPAAPQPAVAAEPIGAEANDSRTAADLLIVTRLGRPGSGLSQAEAAKLAQVIVEEAKRHRFEPALVMAVIHVESSGRSLAVSPVGALGLMQIMPPTGRELAARHGIPWEGPDTLLDPVVNVKLGVAYLRRLTDRYQDVSTALAAYNWGPGRIDRRLRSGEKLPTLYRDRVMRAYDSTRQEIAVGRS